MDCYCVNLPSGDNWIYILIYMWIYGLLLSQITNISSLRHGGLWYPNISAVVVFFIEINVIEMTKYNQEAFHYTRNSRDNFWVEDGVLNIKWGGNLIPHLIDLPQPWLTKIVMFHPKTPPTTPRNLFWHINSAVPKWNNSKKMLKFCNWKIRNELLIYHTWYKRDFRKKYWNFSDVCHSKAPPTTPFIVLWYINVSVPERK